ncbi:MAG: rhomboid family intramembrane serine protease [Thermoanaerobaculia bacterium]
MFRKRGENLHSVYILLFLTVAFFFLEYQDPQRYANLFRFDWSAFASGDAWRIFTYQFTEAGQGWLFIPKPLVLFFTMLVLYIMGTAVEEEWGTRNFLMFFAISTIGSALTAALLGVPLLGSYFVNFSLLFVYASIVPDQTFYLFAVIPIRVRWLAYVAASLLAFGVLFGGPANTAAFAGAAVSYAFYFVHRLPAPPPKQARVESRTGPDGMAMRNATRFAAIKHVIASGSTSDFDRLITQCDRDVIRGVNICPPADYKPDNIDGYCIRCEGFSECSARYLRANRRQPVTEAPVAAPVPEPTRS